MIARIDVWLGLRVFQPPAILLCWLLRCTQHRLNRDMWFVIMAWMTWRGAYLNHYGWAVTVIMGICCLASGAVASFVHQHVPTVTFRWYRMLIMVFLITETAAVPVSGQWWMPLEDIWILIAEYAATITNLPPPPTFKVRRTAKEKSYAS